MKQYKLLEITIQYENFIRQFYQYHTDISNLSYDELFTEIVENCFAESDFIHRQLNEMGIESKVVFYNNRNLQDKWCPHQKNISYFEILLLQIKDFMPDVIMISDICFFSQNETIAIKDCLGSKKIKLIGYHFTTLTDSFKKNAILYDQIYTGNKVYLSFMKNIGLPSYLLRHAFEPSILDKIAKYNKKNEICFLGSIIVGENAHSNRLELLDAMIKSKIPYTFYGNIYGQIQEVIASEKGKKYINIIAGIAKDMKKEVFGTKYYTIMSEHKICLNMHGMFMDYGAGNMRMFEATGIGACLLTDLRSENSELFDVDREIVVYDSLNDMVEKAKWLLDNPKRAKQIALAGQKKTLEKYTYRHKAEQLNEYIQKIL